jgi:putative tricarboxylic transport membrane protein
MTGRSLARRYLHLLTGAILVAVAVAYLWMAAQVRLPPLGDPLGPRLFPMVLAVALVAFSLVFLAATLLRPHKGDDAENMPAQARAWAALALAAGFALILPHAGFMISTAIFALAALELMRFRTLPVNALTAVVIAGIFHIVFRVWLGVPLPGPAFW